MEKEEWVAEPLEEEGDSDPCHHPGKMLAGSGSGIAPTLTTTKSNLFAIVSKITA